ncbi:Cellulase [Syntrophobotulus glycolicus DSM 8271]|uniref:Cellulase n=1 Tax=Syntrophobotulus glycolicus (strain DSM 8271 / FlGlyR) TaxID=645991 RepID=F0SZJ4_SYNGF|nr:M20/M25/M40 family metallo-hydrolase [Syntrophobotulus glycolicus]ADY56080.1 Cellulase [Syntrophobotulus glycolicus DSM 8271]
MNHENFAEEILFKLADCSAISGFEQKSLSALQSVFASLAAEAARDPMGNTTFLKKGGAGRGKIMLAAHFDEIGLMITGMDERGILTFTPVGGIDHKTLLNQTVIVHGRRDLKGIICYEPRSLLRETERNIAVPSSRMGIDLGLPAAKVRELIRPGDIVSIEGRNLRLLNGLASGKAFDNRAGITAMAVCLRELTRLRHAHDVYAVATVQEEVGLRGAAVSSHQIEPDIAFILDVTHAQTTDSKDKVKVALGKGPVIALGPNIHSGLLRYVRTCAKDHRIPVQLDPTPRATGTDARVIQLTGAGIPTALLSVPLRYMHSSIETISLSDIVSCGILLAQLIANLPEDLEEILCF